MSISAIVENPFFYTLVSGLVAAVVSVGLSGRFAERAAANYTLKQGRRRQHHIALMGKPAEDLIQQAQNFRQYYEVSIDYSRRPKSLLARTVHQSMKGEKRDSTEIDFLISHLDTGYPEPFAVLSLYQEDCNKVANAVLNIAKDMSMKLMEAKLLPPCPEIGNPIPDWCDYLQAAVDFVGISFARWESGRNDINLPKHNKVRDELGDGFNVSWVMVVGRTSTEEKAEELESALEAFTRSSYEDKLIEQFKKRASLDLQGSVIREFLEALRIKVKAGVPLKGSCIAGEEAEPKFE